MCIILFSCKKEIDFSAGEGALSFSVDTLLFDTVFTNVGSTTRYLKVYNNSNVDINLNAVRIGKGSNSKFRLNVDGEPDYNVQNILIRGNDSLYIFSDVTIDPTENNKWNAFIDTCGGENATSSRRAGPEAPQFAS